MNTLFAQLKEAARIRYHYGELGGFSSRQEKFDWYVVKKSQIWDYIKIVPKQIAKRPIQN